MSTTSISRVVVGEPDKEHDAFLRECCRYVMERGGAFSIETRHEGHWYRVYTIVWPDGKDGEE